MPLTKNKLRELRELAHKKYRDEQKKFIIEGIRLVQEAVDSDYTMLEAYYTPEVTEEPQGKQLLKRLREKTPMLYQTTAREMEVISETVHFQGVFAVLRQKEYSVQTILQQSETGSLLVAFDNISDPGNVGTMVRTCDWFGVNGVLLGRNSAELYNPKVVRATMGGVFHLPIGQDVDLRGVLSTAKALGYTIYTTDLKGETHFDHVNYDAKSIIVFGNEAWGVSDELKRLADYRVVIRRYGAAESLNVSIACGVILSQVHKLYD